MTTRPPSDDPADEPVEPRPDATRVLDDLAADLDGVRLGFEAPGAAQTRSAVTAASRQLADHLVPRLQSVDAPLLVVVGGSTGAGKSTLLNALVGRPVTRAGAIRPTTRRPVLLHHPEDAPWFEGTRILPGLARVRGGAGAGAPSAGSEDEPSRELELRPLAEIPRGLALLDAPDIDSIAAGNRELARQLLRAADLWLFVTTANRYADAVPWEVLRTAVEADATVAVVMNRIPERPGIAEELETDLRAMLEDRGLEPARLFLVPESSLSAEGMLDHARVGEIDAWLHALAADQGARGAIARRTLAGALDSLDGTLQDVAAGVEEQGAIREELAAAVDDAFADVVERIEAAVGDGSLLRGEVLARWQEVVGTGEIVRSLESLVGRVRDRLGRALRGEGRPAVAAQDALETGLVHVVVDETARGAEHVEQAWRSHPAGRPLVEGADLSRMEPGYEQQVARAVRDWQGDVLELVRSEGADRRTKARILSLGVNAVGVALMVVVFASTAFIPTGLEVGTGAATAIVGQKLLETIFGEDAVRRLARVARESLAARLEGLVAERAEPFRERLDAVPEGTEPAALRADARGAAALAADIRTRAEQATGGRTVPETTTQEHPTQEHPSHEPTTGEEPA
ncbi:dynamin family protein [Brachybacterium halotolerans subsp. kimchii]|uniref:dynamin family protein n=1 Tax=Brachybacterium halotolerans TaxID=2795215 RepID=UPI001E396CD4|nr:dynamin family protein [Brachybacterium halotolerans]UEJ82249.1 dynamin family protein [Brachybacterium halotolerans subsp. kimchii]